MSKTKVDDVALAATLTELREEREMYQERTARYRRERKLTLDMLQRFSARDPVTAFVALASLYILFGYDHRKIIAAGRAAFPNHERLERWHKSEER